MTQWEYLQISFRLSALRAFLAQLDEYGSRGWEQVSMAPVETKRIGWFDSGSETSGIIAFFKRQKQLSQSSKTSVN